MTLKERIDLGQFIALADDKPVKFQVAVNHLGADSGDPLNRIPYYVIFTPIDGKSIEFVVKISSNLRDFYFDKHERDMFFYAVKFGLISFSKNSKVSEFDFFTQEYENMKTSVMPPGLKVREEILKFIYKIYSQYPSWGINEFHLRTNINADEDQIRQWAEELVRGEYFNSTRIDINNIIYGGTIVLPHYYINPKMRKEIELELAQLKTAKDITSKGLEIFISYSHGDKILAGQIKEKLETNGYRTFLAHDDIKIDEDWRLEILRHLKSCNILLALITNSFNDSEWTHQEVGHCVGKEKMIISLRLGGKLEGFLEARQALPVEGDDATKICEKVLACIKNNAEFENIA
jgi:hypothetical protein